MKKNILLRNITIIALIRKVEGNEEKHSSNEKSLRVVTVCDVIGGAQNETLSNCFKRVITSYSVSLSINYSWEFVIKKFEQLCFSVTTGIEDKNPFEDELKYFSEATLASIRTRIAVIA